MHEPRRTNVLGWMGYGRKSFCYWLFVVAAALYMLCITASGGISAEAAYPFPGTVSIKSSHSFAELGARLEQAVEANGFFVVTRASASAGAAARGVEIPGNLVIGVFRNDYAVRMLEASVPAGVEAPLRFYVTENPDGTATLTYRRPTAVFVPYGVATLDAMAAELDPIWERIVQQATDQ